MYNMSLSIQVQPISTVPIWGDNVYNGHKNAKENLKSQEKSKLSLHEAVAIQKVKNIFDQFYHRITKIDMKFKFYSQICMELNNLAFLHLMAHAKVPST